MIMGAGVWQLLLMFMLDSFLTIYVVWSYQNASYGEFLLVRSRISRADVFSIAHVYGCPLWEQRRSPTPDDLLTFVRPLCRPAWGPKTMGLQGSTRFVVGDVRSLSLV